MPKINNTAPPQAGSGSALPEITPPGCDPMVYARVRAATIRDATEIEAQIPSAIEEDRKRIAASVDYRRSGSASCEGAIARARGSFTRGMARMVETGNYLLTCKDTKVHGEFLAWLKNAENWPYGYTWAAYCMQCARDYEHLSIEEQGVYLQTSFADRKKQIAEQRKEEKRAKAEAEAEDAEFTVTSPRPKVNEVETSTMVEAPSSPALTCSLCKITWADAESFQRHRCDPTPDVVDARFRGETRRAISAAQTFNPIEPSCAPAPALLAATPPDAPDLAALAAQLMASPLDLGIFRALAFERGAVLRLGEIERRPEHYALLLLRDAWVHLSDSSRRLRGSRGAALSAWADRLAELLDVIEPVAKQRA